MNHRQWKKNYKKQYGYNPPAYMDKRKRRKARAQQSLPCAGISVEQITQAMATFTEAVFTAAGNMCNALAQAFSRQAQAFNAVADQYKDDKAGQYMGNNKEIQRQQYNRTVTMLKQYRDAQFFIQHTTDEESRQRTEAAVQHITAALEEIQRRRQQAEREEEYTALRMYYMQGYTYEQIEKELNTGKDTPRRWITAAVKELAVMVYGIE